jgi:alpha-tubulin suppressor-like RCC1 family protein
VDSKGIAWSWGVNGKGELGTGDQDSRAPPYPVLNLKGKKVSSIACGNEFVIALGNTVKKEIPGLIIDGKSKKRTKRDGSRRSIGGSQGQKRANSKRSTSTNNSGVGYVTNPQL